MCSAVSTDGAALVDGPAPADSHAQRQQLVRRPIPVATLAIAFAVLSLASYPALTRGAVAAFIAVVLVVAAATDLERRIIPNRVVLPATAVVLIARMATSPGRWLEWLAAGLGAALFFLLPNLINR